MPRGRPASPQCIIEDTNVMNTDAILEEYNLTSLARISDIIPWLASQTNS